MLVLVEEAVKGKGIKMREIIRLLTGDQLWLNVARAQSLPRRVKLSDALGRGVDVPLLERVGLATEYDGRVVFRECLDQPVRVIEKLLPSLLSLKHGVGFKGDVEVARRKVKGFITLDSLARGGRSTLDALAIELVRPERVAVEARYPAEMVRKVVEDLRAMMYGREIAEVGGSEDS